MARKKDQIINILANIAQNIDSKPDKDLSAQDQRERILLIKETKMLIKGAEKESKDNIGNTNMKIKEQKKRKSMSLKKDVPEIKYEGKIFTFSIYAPHAKNVMLGGDFNNWDYQSTHLINDSTENIWKKEFHLKPGRYEYKFFVDGKWIVDPNNDHIAYNKFGTENSVVEIR